MDKVSGIPVSDEPESFPIDDLLDDPISLESSSSTTDGFSTVEDEIDQEIHKENILDSYFKLSKENNITIFYDRDHKHFIMVYNDNIRDDSRNIYLGYRNLGDVFAGQEKNTIRICPRRQFEKRITNKRYIYSGYNPKMILVLLKLIKKNRFDECLSDISRNLNVLSTLYLEGESK